MPKVKADRLKEIAQVLLEAAGTPAVEAETVARLVIGANLAGHDSHGIIAIPTYIDRVEVGHIVPGAKWEILRETPATTVVDGHWGFGFVVTERALRYTVEKAKKIGVAATTVRRQGHIGRVAAYPLMAAKEGVICMMTADSGRSPKAVAPYGGREARLGTNPISIAVPSELEAPIFLDMATSAAAAGKINLSLARGDTVPEHWIIDSNGKHTGDPKQLKQGGALLPLGGTEGYKGTGLATMVEILSGILPGLGFGVEPSGRHNDGTFIACFDVAAFADPAEFKKDVTDFANYLKATKPAEGSQGVLYTGEVEHMREQERMKNGVDVEEATWKKLQALADKYKVADRLKLEAA